MSSAAVIGRQLRQQQSSNRVPGPVVPPTQYRGRTPQINNINYNNYNNSNNQFQSTTLNIDSKPDSLTLFLGADADKKFAKFSQQYSSNSHDFYPHPAHRENSDTKSQHDKNRRNHNKKDNSIKFTKHCFCVAFKALSTGVVLFVVGTVMSVLGFFAESLAIEQSTLTNGTVITTINKGTKQHLHNMTYVGPVIMGLGLIVIVAACVLTFEVRDTLGIKDDPKKRKSNSVEKSTISSNLTIPEEDVIPDITVPPVALTNANTSRRFSQVNHHKPFTAVEMPPSTSNKPATNARPTTLNDVECSTIYQQRNPKHANKKTANDRSKTNHKTNHHHKSAQQPAPPPPNNPPIQTVDRLSQLSINSTDLSYCQIPSPVDIELSDPEGCSLTNASMTTATTTTTNLTAAAAYATKWRSRCSCSGSPTNSMLMALHKIVDDIDTIDSSPQLPFKQYLSATILNNNNHHHYPSQQHSHHRKLSASNSNSNSSIYFDQHLTSNNRRPQSNQHKQQSTAINSKQIMIASIDDLSSLYSCQSSTLSIDNNNVDRHQSQTPQNMIPRNNNHNRNNNNLIINNQYPIINTTTTTTTTVNSRNRSSSSTNTTKDNKNENRSYPLLRMAGMAAYNQS